MPEEITHPAKDSQAVAHQRIVLDHCPQDGREWDCQCARCGSSLTWEACSECGGEGRTAPGELHEQDPLWYHPGDTEVCGGCGGDGGNYFCLSSAEWCEAHPMEGREAMESGRAEWFCIENASLSHEEGAK